MKLSLTVVSRQQSTSGDGPCTRELRTSGGTSIRIRKSGGCRIIDNRLQNNMRVLGGLFQIAVESLRRISMDVS